ncbi:MAG: D-aminoacylase [Anaerolineae bacterium]|jgi:N-acyl-D-amino-acid deacylase
MLDILIQNAEIVDGTNTPRYRGDVAIERDRIAHIGALEGAAARTVIDATDRVVVPGFIDMHSHADLSLLVEPEAESLVRQGITTVVTGQCGMSPAPLTEEHREDTLGTLGMLLPPEVSMPWDEISSFASFLGYLEKAEMPVNVVPLVGQGMIRAAVLGYRANVPTQDETEQMQRQVHEAMEVGAHGVSTGLIYPPGSFTSTEELIDVVRPVAEYRGLYFSHIRSEAELLLESVAEAIEIGRQAGVAVQVSHFKASGRQNWHKAPAALELIDRARAEGLDVTADMYPYTGGATYLAALLPTWALEGGTPGLLRRLDLPEERTRIVNAMEAGKDRGVGTIEWDKILIAGSANRAYVGHAVSELAAQEETDPLLWTLDALRATAGKVTMVMLSMAEDNVRMQLRHPAMMFCTDGLGVSIEGPMAMGIMHPRFCGTYPRIFGRYVREGLLSLEAASWKASGFPAKKLGLADRGLIREGYKADLVLFDPETIQDRATYPEPLKYPAGIDAVLVNGEVVVEGGQQTRARPGRILRRQS